MLRDLAVAKSLATGMLQGRLHRALFILVRAPEPSGLVGAEAVPLRVLLRPLAEVARDLRPAGFFRRFYPVKAIGEPIIGAVIEDDYGRECRGAGQRFHVIGARL